MTEKPDPRLAAAAEQVGVVLLPWQIVYGNALLRGEHLVLTRSRRQGWTVFGSVLRALRRPAAALSPDEYDKVRAFGLHRRLLLNEDIRGGLLTLAGVVLCIVVVATAVVGLIWVGVTHP